MLSAFKRCGKSCTTTSSGLKIVETIQDKYQILPAQNRRIKYVTRNNISAYTTRSMLWLVWQIERLKI